MATQFLRCQKAFLLTTAAQNIPVFLPKSPLHKKHFSKWLKTANSSTAYGTVTLKSLPSRGSDAPHVHQRPRKRPPRCTLDCGFKTPESPALRGFVAGLRALATAALYLVLKSNGPHRSKNFPVKFGFSPKIVPINIAKKLPSQLYPKPLFIVFFNFSYKRPTFVYIPESVYTLAFANRIAHSGLPFCNHSLALCCQRNSFYSAMLLYTYISRFSVNPHCQQQLYLRPSFIPVFNFSHKRSTFAFTGESGYTLGFRKKIAHKGTHAETGAFRTGVVSLPSDRSARFGNPVWPGLKTANFAAFGSWSGVLSKNAESLRDSDALMRVAVPKASRPRWAA